MRCANFQVVVSVAAMASSNTISSTIRLILQIFNTQIQYIQAYAAKINASINLGSYTLMLEHKYTHYYCYN